MCIESFSPFVEFLEFHLVAVAFRRALKPIKFHCLLQFSYRVQSLAGSPPDSDRDPWKLPSSCSALPLRFTHLTLDINTKWGARKKKKKEDSNFSLTDMVVVQVASAVCFRQIAFQSSVGNVFASLSTWRQITPKELTRNLRCKDKF